MRGRARWARAGGAVGAGARWMRAGGESGADRRTEPAATRGRPHAACRGGPSVCRFPCVRGLFDRQGGRARIGGRACLPFFPRSRAFRQTGIPGAGFLTDRRLRVCRKPCARLRYLSFSLRTQAFRQTAPTPAGRAADGRRSETLRLWPLDRPPACEPARCGRKRGGDRHRADPLPACERPDKPRQRASGGSEHEVVEHEGGV